MNIYPAEPSVGCISFVKLNQFIGKRGKGLRNTNKKLNIYAFTLVLLLLVSLVGCGGASDKGKLAMACSVSRG